MLNTHSERENEGVCIFSVHFKGVSVACAEAAASPAAFSVEVDAGEEARPFLPSSVALSVDAGTAAMQRLAPHDPEAAELRQKAKGRAGWREAAAEAAQLREQAKKGRARGASRQEATEGAQGAQLLAEPHAAKEEAAAKGDTKPVELKKAFFSRQSRAGVANV